MFKNNVVINQDVLFLSCRSEHEVERCPSKCELSVDLIVVYYVNFEL